MQKELQQPLERPYVLIVEDDPDVSQLLAYRLQQRGYQVRSVGSGYRILRTLQERRPDLVVLDLMLPDMDGLQVCHLIKTTDRYADIPVVIVTARGEEARIESLQAGADVFLKKSGFLKGIDEAARQLCPIRPAFGTTAFPAREEAC